MQRDDDDLLDADIDDLLTNLTLAEKASLISAMDRSFLDADIDDLLTNLTLAEKASLISAPDWWNTHPIPRLNIPSLRLSDGPNGVRGSSHLISTPAQCLPCATCLASTFDPLLVSDVGVYLAQEAKVKSATVLLAPTCNIQRSPLGGRAFESFSEDPLLSGTLAAAYINGLQSQGVSATIKHFVANDQEHERTAVNSVVSERALREIYLYPFMIAQRDAKPWAYMTSYNRLNGIHCSEDPHLLQSILREEWDFKGLVISDWFGTYSLAEAINAGLDLEMPGPPRWRTFTLVNSSLGSAKITPRVLDERVRNVLEFVKKVANEEGNADIVYGNGKEGTVDSEERRKFARRVAGEGVVLLKNDNAVLPIEEKKVAVIGPNATAKIISGGGSAALKPTYVITPLSGLKSTSPPGIEITHSVGCYAHKFLPTLEDIITTPTGKQGWTITFYNHDGDGNPLNGEKIDEFDIPDTKVRLNDFLPEGLTEGWTTVHRGLLEHVGNLERDVEFEIGLAVAGKARVWVGGKLVIELWEEQEPGEFYYGQGSAEKKAVVTLKAGEKTEVEVEYTNVMPKFSKRSNMQPALMRGFRLGGIEKIDPKSAIRNAAKLAGESDVAIVVVGLNPDWESEGFDRKDLGLPGEQDELVEEVAKANGRCVVVVQAGSAISMPWLSKVSGVLYAWYGGNESGHAIADIIFGRVNPSGRLPLTLPVKEEDVPAYLNFGSERGTVHYREDLYVGYKWYQARGVKAMFPFGFGLSYSSSKISDLQISGPTLQSSFKATVLARVTNTGARSLREVVQVYVEYPTLEGGLSTPRLQLRGFAKTEELAPKDNQLAKINLDKYAFAYWDVERKAWRVEKGVYKVHAGKSSEELSFVGEIEVEKEMSWVGI